MTYDYLIVSFAFEHPQQVAFAPELSSVPSALLVAEMVVLDEEPAAGPVLVVHLLICLFHLHHLVAALQLGLLVEHLLVWVHLVLLYHDLKSKTTFTIFKATG